MTNVPAANEPASSETQLPSIQKMAFAIAAIIGIIIVLVFLVGLLLVLLTPDITATAARMQYFRDIVMIVVLVQGITVIVAIATLIVQVSRLIIVLKQEASPVLQDTQEVARTAKQTTSFLSKQIAQPLVQFGGLIAGLGILLRDIGGIRRVVKTNSTDANNATEEDI
jgi:hypothetical protein